MPLIASAIGASAAGSIGTGLLGYFGSQSAAKKQEQAAQQAIDLQRSQFNQTRADLAPYRAGGEAGLNQLMALLGLGPAGAGGGQQAALAATPGYQFTLGQGLDALQNSLAARGGAMGGNALKAIMGYGQGLANTTFQQGVGNAANLAGLGEGAAAQTGQFGANSANAISSLLTGQGNAAAAGIMGGTNALAGGLQGLTQSGLNYALLTQLANMNAGGGAGALSPANINLSGAFVPSPTSGFATSIYGPT